MNYIKIIRNILFAFIMLVQCSVSQNQITTELPQRACIVGEFGLGLSSADAEYVVGAVYETDQFLYALRFSSQSEFDLFDTYTPDNKNILLDALLGIRKSVWLLRFSMSTGISYIHQMTRGHLIQSGGGLFTEGGPSSYESIKQVNIGIPFHGSIAFRDPLYGVFQGVIACHASFSKLRPIWGISFTTRWYIFEL